MAWTERELAEYQERQSRFKSRLKPTGESLKEAIERANAKATAPTEDLEQVALVNWLRFKKIRHFAVPNGGDRHKVVAAKLKAQGVVPGVQDIIIMPPVGSSLPILFVEMKRIRGGSLSDDQKSWRDYIEALSATHPVKPAVCKGCMEAIKFIESEGY